MVLSGVELEVWNSNKFDGANTRRVRYTTTYSVSDTVDIDWYYVQWFGWRYHAPGQVTGLVVAPPVSDTQLNLNWNARHRI